LKERVKQLDNSLLPNPLFVDPIVAISPLNSLEDIIDSSSRLRSVSSLLMTIRKYIGDNIHKRIYLILEIWELATTSTTLSSRILNFREYFQKHLENDEHFYKKFVDIFSSKVSNMNDVHRREQHLPSKILLRQINTCWLKMNKCLREILVDCDTINTKRSDVFLKLVDLKK